MAEIILSTLDRAVRPEDPAAIIPEQIVPLGATRIKLAIPFANWVSKQSLVSVQAWRSEDGGLGWVPSGGFAAIGGGDPLDSCSGEFDFGNDEKGNPRASDGTWIVKVAVAVTGDPMDASVSLSAK